MYSIIDFESPLKPVTTRSCDGCTSCCEGWLTCTIYGYDVAPGKPCRFMGKSTGCSAYEVRPYNPCKTFLCYWKQDSSIPEHFKPSISKNILLFRKSLEGILHLDIVEAGKPVSLEILNWALMRFRTKKVNSVRWWFDGKLHYVSRDEQFIELMEKRLIEIGQIDE